MIDYLSLTVKQQKRYDRILRAAEEMMYEQSFYKMSITELTTKLSVSRSTIYDYFGSKEGLVEKVVDTISERLNNSLSEIVKDDSVSSRAKFIKLAKKQSQNLNTNCYRLLNDLKIHTPHLYLKFEESRKKREEYGYKMLIEQGITDGVFDKKFSSDFLVQLYLKMGQLTGDTDILDNISMNKQEAMETIVKVFLDGTRKHINLI
jgi:AcrR family transcriptional regulator